MGASYEESQYDIEVQQKIDAGLEAAERGDFISDEEIERRIAGGLSNAAPISR